MIKVLDSGYVKLIDKMGTDESIIEAARMSVDKGFQGWGGAPCPACEAAGRLDPVDHLFKTAEAMEAAHVEKCLCRGKGTVIGDEGLLSYLYRNKHATPFEMVQICIEVKAPIFIFREWHRHRTQSYNEMSARYIKMPDENYMPDISRVLISGGTNKQAQGLRKISPEDAAVWMDRLNDFYRVAEEMYQFGIDAGVPKELARLAVPVARYSRMRASANLRNWLAFLTLRADPAAQWEIQQYAQAVGQIIAEHYPRTWDLFIEGRQNARA